MESLKARLRQGNWVFHPRALRAFRLWALAAPFVLIGAMMSYLSDGLSNGRGKAVGEDFINYWTGARLLLDGAARQAYDFDAFLAFERAVVGAALEPYHYSYPPSLMVLTAPFALLPFPVALVCWTLGGYLAAYFLFRPHLPPRWALFAALGTPAVFVNALYGQNGALTALFLGGGLYLLPKRPWIAGILLGLLSFKPHLGILLPIALLCAREGRAFLGAAAGALGLGLIATLAAGPEVWLDFLARIEWMGARVLTHGSGLWHRMPTGFASVRFLGGAPGLAWAVQIFVAAAALAATIYAWRPKANIAPAGRALALALAALLASPYAWDYDMVVLAPLIAWRFQEGELKPWEASLLAILGLMPLWLAPCAKLLGLPLGVPALLGALWAVTQKPKPPAEAGGSG